VQPAVNPVGHSNQLLLRPNLLPTTAASAGAPAAAVQVVALLVASHYKNTPNDLLLLADAPAHQLFVLLGPVDPTQNAMPDVLAVVQVSECVGELAI
jgi:tRNA(Met) C34 N-acetyltransferase TmcA